MIDQLIFTDTNNIEARKEWNWCSRSPIYSQCTPAK